MSRGAFLSLALLSLSAATPCAAQHFASTVRVTPTIRLSSEETATAKQLVQALTNAQDRVRAAKARWDAFDKEFLVAHPGPVSWEFSSDFTAAYVVYDSHAWVATATTVELSAEERQKAQALFNELKAGDDAVNNAQKNWENFETGLLMKYVPGITNVGRTPPSDSTFIGPVNGNYYTVSYPWRTEIALTPDFKTAIPR